VQRYCFFTKPKLFGIFFAPTTNENKRQ
jgi:hypothetical protein